MARGFKRIAPHARSRTCPAALLMLASAGTALAACGGPPTATSSTPLATAQSWFRAINSKDLHSAQDHFAVSQRSMMDWGGGDTATWSTFTHLHCKTLRDSGKVAIVYCSFSESASPSEGNPDSFWTISMERNTGGTWLINNYGQG
jgi:hypothetical protein